MDVLLLETVYDTLNAKAAIYALMEFFSKNPKDIPLMVSATISSSQTLLSKQDVFSFFVSIRHAPNLLALGLNCSLGPPFLGSFLDGLSTFVDVYTIFYPSAGLPDSKGNYPYTPELMAELVKEYAKRKWLNIVGGCCGTTPKHIQYIAEVVARYQPRKPKENNTLQLSGLKKLEIHSNSNLVFICDISELILKIISFSENRQFSEIFDEVYQELPREAKILFINIDALKFNYQEDFKSFFKTLSQHTKLGVFPLMLSSSRWHDLEHALENLQGKSIVDGASIEEEISEIRKKIEFLRKYGVAVSLKVQTSKENLQKKAKTLQKLYEILTKEIKVPPKEILFEFSLLEDLLFDNTLSAIKFIKTKFRYSSIIIRFVSSFQEKKLKLNILQNAGANLILMKPEHFEFRES